MSIDKHPPAAIERAGIISYITFNWIQPMLLHGRVTITSRHALTHHFQGTALSDTFAFLFSNHLFLLSTKQRHTLTSEDLEQLSQNDQVQRLADLMLREWSREVESKKQPCIHSEMKRPNLYKVLW